MTTPDPIEAVVVQAIHPRFNVLSAPPRTAILLDFIQGSDPRDLHISRDTITMAGQVAYRVVGWDTESSSLILDLVEDYR